MSYKINELAKLSGVSTRTLRYYDEIDLLKPEATDENGYRIYKQKQVDLLQSILFYREFDIALKDIKEILSASDFDRNKSLEEHLIALETKREKIDKMILNLKTTIKSEKEGIKMTDKEKFEGLREKALQENELKYGKELREKFGDEVIDKSNQKIRKMSKNNYEEIVKVTNSINDCLKKAMEDMDPSSDIAQKACEFHEELLLMTWADGTYSKEAQLALVESFIQEEGFTAYYEKIHEGCTKFFRDATKIYCEK